MKTKHASITFGRFTAVASMAGDLWYVINQNGDLGSRKLYLVAGLNVASYESLTIIKLHFFVLLFEFGWVKKEKA